MQQPRRVLPTVYSLQSTVALHVWSLMAVRVQIVAPVCNSSAWYNDSIPFVHQGLKPPFKQPGAAATAMACCELCGSAANQKKGCSFWVWSSEGKKCYLKASVRMAAAPTAKPGWVAGSIHPWATPDAHQ